jgi:hypothetical protein
MKTAKELAQWFKTNNCFIPEHCKVPLSISKPLEEQYSQLQSVYDFTKDWQNKNDGMCSF